MNREDHLLLRIIRSLKEWLTRISAEYKEINRSLLFDREFYLSFYEDVAEQKQDPLIHFLRSGQEEGRLPNPLFSPEYYRSQLPADDPLKSKPLLHYIRNSISIDKSPHPLLDFEYYFQQMPKNFCGDDVDPLAHYLREGHKKGLNPHPLLDTEYFTCQIAKKGLKIDEYNSLLLYFDRRDYWFISPHPLFDATFYYNEYLKDVGCDIPLLQHYFLYGRALGYDPHPCFNSKWYCYQHLDQVDSTSNPLSHYVTCGLFEGREPLPPAKNTKNKELSRSFLILVLLDEFTRFHKKCIRTLAILQYKVASIVCFVEKSLQHRVETFLKSMKQCCNIRCIYYSDRDELVHYSNTAILDSKAAYVAHIQHPIVLHNNFIDVILKFFQTYPNTKLVYSDHTDLNNSHKTVVVKKTSWSPELQKSTLYVGDFYVSDRNCLVDIIASRKSNDLIWGGDFFSYIAKHINAVGHIPYSLYSTQENTQRIADRPYLCDQSKKGSKESSAVLSIIVGIYNSNDLDLLNLDALLHATHGLNIEIILSCFYEDEEKAVFLSNQYDCLRVVLNNNKENVSPAQMLNYACSKSQGDWFVFLVPGDVVLDNRYFDVLKSYLEKEESTIVGLTYWTGESDPVANSWVANSWLSFLAGYFSEVDRYTTCWQNRSIKGDVVARETPLVVLHGMAVRKEFFNICGGFNTLYKNTFFDFDLCMKAAKKNKTTIEIILPYDISGSVDIQRHMAKFSDTLDSNLFLDTWRPSLQRILAPHNFLFDLQDVYNKKRQEICSNEYHLELGV